MAELTTKIIIDCLKETGVSVRNQKYTNAVYPCCFPFVNKHNISQSVS